MHVQGICIARPVALTVSLGYSILILESCGESLNMLSSEELTGLNPIPSCMDSLRLIHSAGVVHGDLALRNIARKRSTFTVLDWETSSPYDADGGKADEKALLAALHR